MTVTRKGLLLAIGLIALVPDVAWAQSAPIVYPAAGQSLDQQASEVVLTVSEGLPTTRELNLGG